MRLSHALCLIALVGVSSAKDQARPANRGAGAAARAGVKTPGIQIAFQSVGEEAAIAFTATPVFSLVEGQALLVVQQDSTAIVRVANRDTKLQEPLNGPEKPCAGAAAGFGSLWIPDCASQSLHRVDLKTGRSTAKIAVGNGSALPAVAASTDSLWVLSDGRGTLSRIDPETNTVVAEIRLEAGCSSIAFEQNALWIPCTQSNRVLKVNPRTNLVEKRIAVADKPVALTYGENHLWVLGAKEGKISKLDPKTDKVIATIDTEVPEAGGSLSFGGGFLWVSQTGFPLTKVDASKDKVMQQFWGEGGGMVKFAFNAVWMSDAKGKRLVRYDPKRIAATLPE
jgi:DNA-binding beta-propeller fold protein YncE